MLYDGFDLRRTVRVDDHQRPGADILAMFFMNTAMEQQLTKFRADNAASPTDE